MKAVNSSQRGPCIPIPSISISLSSRLLVYSFLSSLALFGTFKPTLKVDNLNLSLVPYDHGLLTLVSFPLLQPIGLDQV